MREKKELNVQIGERIKLARENARLTQEQFAERIGVSPQFVSDLERGVVGISLATLKRICVTLGISSDRILFGTDTDDEARALAEKFRGLNDTQRAQVADIVTRLIDALAQQ